MVLIEPEEKYLDSIEVFRSDFGDTVKRIAGCGPLTPTIDLREWLEFVRRLKDEKTTPSDMVPCTQYFYMRETDNKIVGCINIRYGLNERLGKYYGHIGYSVCPSERRKGYATQMLRDALVKCKEHGLNRVLITCNTDNEGSRRVIEVNGGIFDYTVLEPDSGKYIERYWIDIK